MNIFLPQKEFKYIIHLLGTIKLPLEIVNKIPFRDL